jgi:hypothetical protein
VITHTFSEDLGPVPGGRKSWSFLANFSEALHHRERRWKQQRGSNTTESTLLWLSQNVRGILKEDAAIDMWFDGLRSKTDLGFIDIALLQETRATDRWNTRLKYKYAAGWGHRDDEQFAQWSFWGPSQEAAGGVAILIRPRERATMRSEAVGYM